MAKSVVTTASVERIENGWLIVDYFGKSQVRKIYVEETSEIGEAIDKIFADPEPIPSPGSPAAPDKDK